MFDVVTTDEYKPAAGIHGCRVKNLQARLTVAAATDERRWATAAHDQEHHDEEQQRNTDAAGSNEEATAISAHQVIEHLHILPSLHDDFSAPWTRHTCPVQPVEWRGGITRAFQECILAAKVALLLVNSITLHG
jgi:hypothetical protein